VITIESAHKKGVPLTVIAPGAYNLNSAPSNVLIVAKNSPLRTAKDSQWQGRGDKSAAAASAKFSPTRGR